jgi:hypothetical protein
MKISVNGIERKDVAGFDHNETQVFLTFKNGSKKTFQSMKGWDIIRGKTSKSRTLEFVKK